MNGYLTPEIGQAVAQLAQTCDDLTRQVLIRELTKKTQEWCQGDPELADVILEGKKSLEGCVKYVLEQAAAIVAKSVAAMPKEEVDMLPTQTINGKKATMAGGCVAAEQAFQWAQDYYYKVKETAQHEGKIGKPGQKSTTKKGSSAKPEKDTAGAKAGSDTAAIPKKSETGDAPQQMMLGDVATA
jgi:hypothetical protein